VCQCDLRAGCAPAPSEFPDTNIKLNDDKNQAGGCAC